MSNYLNAKRIVLGAVIGGALGGIAVTLLASNNNGKGLRGTCEEYGDKIKNIISEMSNNIAGNINEKTAFMSDKTKEIIESIKDEIGEFPDLENKDFKKGLIVGGILGGLLGSGTTWVCKGNNEERNSQAYGWQKMAKNVLEILDTKSQSKHEAPHQSKTVHDVFDFAVAGLQLWKNINRPHA